jgi:hypothetical protein
MKKLSEFLIFLFLSFPAIAANISGGDISVNCLGGNTEQFIIRIWGNHFSVADSLQMDLGNNTVSYSDQSAFSITSLAPNFPNDSEIKWVFTHTYPGPGTYVISAYYQNRDAGIANVPNSGSTVFTLMTDLTLDPAIGCNNSPVITNPNLIEWATVGSNFNYGSGAFDPDSDSISFSVGPCLDTNGIIAGYTLPDVLAGGNFSIDAVNGNISWNVPGLQGKFNVVISIDQWKLFPNGQRYDIGSTMREVQLNVGTGAGIREQNLFAFSFFPNPVSASDDIHFQFKKPGNYTIKIFGADGKTVFENSMYCEITQPVNLPLLAEGIYFLSVSDENQFSSTRKIMIK